MREFLQVLRKEWVVTLIGALSIFMVILGMWLVWESNRGWEQFVQEHKSG